MVKVKRARTVETLKPPNLRLRLRAPYFYPDYVWSCEVDNFYLKTRLGLADFRVRSYEAVDKYMVVVQLAWGYIERRLIQERSAKVKCYGDIIRRHQEEHAREWLTGALQMVLETGAIEPVLQRFLRETD